MKVGGGVGGAISLLLRPKFRSCSSSTFCEYTSFIKDVAATVPPKNLCHLLSMLKTKGNSIVSPGAKQGLLPITFPLAKNDSGTVIALLRWPTAPAGQVSSIILDICLLYSFSSLIYFV
uniref:Uncharacterized protein n=1 Tax=Rhizophora mucronata TaxID=61149 RepID=A0A2P2JDV3_RHIMU